MLRRERRALTFDLVHGVLRPGKDPYATLEPSVRVDEIVGLQVLAEDVRGSDRRYVSHELNLVLSDGRRLNVLDHGSSRAVRRDAETVAAALGVPVWYHR